MGELKIGTCSWKYDSWKGILYPQEGKLNHLKEYSRHLNTVEIDQWFWSLFGEDKAALPRPRIVEEYRQSVPEDFRFTIKLPNSITLTHFYRRDKNAPLKANPHFLSAELFRDFIKSIEPLSGQIGVLMFQFEYLNREKMKSQGEFQQRFSDFLKGLDCPYPLAVEIRNPNYLNKAYFRFLLTHDLSPVLLQGYYMPPVPQIYWKHKPDMGETVIIRLHGPDRSGIEIRSRGVWDQILEPHDDELEDIAKVLSDLLDSGKTVYVNINNHYEGSAPLTIRRLQKIMGDAENYDYE